MSVVSVTTSYVGQGWLTAMSCPGNFLRPEHEYETGHDDVVRGRGVSFLSAKSGNQRVEDDQEGGTRHDQRSTANTVGEEDGHESADCADGLHEHSILEALGSETDLLEEPVPVSLKRSQMAKRRGSRRSVPACQLISVFRGGRTYAL